jgi:hypothetical protein
VGDGRGQKRAKKCHILFEWSLSKTDPNKKRDGNRFHFISFITTQHQDTQYNILNAQDIKESQTEIELTIILILSIQIVDVIVQVDVFMSRDLVPISSTSFCNLWFYL